MRKNLKRKKKKIKEERCHQFLSKKKKKGGVGISLRGKWETNARGRGLRKDLVIKKSL